MPVPLGSCAVQVCMPSLHQKPAAQSASTSQPPAGSQTLLVVLHISMERQTVPPLAAVHGPSLAA